MGSREANSNRQPPPPLDSTEFPPLESAQQNADLSGRNEIPTAWQGQSHTIENTAWRESVVVGLSGGGGELREIQAEESPDSWPSFIPRKEVLHPGPKGELPLLGCSWDPAAKKWKAVEVEKTLVTSEMQFTLRAMNRDDIVAMKPINFACKFTEQFPRAYYEKYLAVWPGLCLSMQCNAQGELAGYVLAKVEMGPEGMYGHVSALTVKADCRRRGVAKRLMAQVELVCAEQHGALYVDLFVKASNTRAQQFYHGQGYVTYRVVAGYYDDADALDMRKSLPADRNNRRMQRASGRRA